LKTQKFIPLLVVAAGLLAYHNSFTGPFIFDDLSSIPENPTIRHLWPVWTIVGHTSRPVVALSLAVNYALGGLNPWGYHLFNLAIHILAALTLYGVVRRTCLLAKSSPTWREAPSWLAVAIAVIWVVHPLQTESVTYIIQRCESLMGLFYLLTLYCVIRSRGSSRSIWWGMGGVVSCALAMGCKPVAASAPVMVLLYERAFLAGSWREIFERRWKMYAGLAATWLLLLPLLANGPGDWKASAGFGYRRITPLQYALTQPAVIVHYLRLSVWPRPLCLDYIWPVAQTAAEVWPGLIAIGALLVVTVWAWRRRPALGFLGAWFFIILAPTSSFIPIADLAVEHRMYLPLAVVVVLGVMGVYDLVGRRTVAVAAVLAVGLGVLTVQRNEDYRGEIAIWDDTVAKCPQNARAHYNLGVALAQAGRVGEVIGHYQQAVRLKPDYVEAQNNLGTALLQLGRVQEAIEQYEQALQLKPDYADAHYNLGHALSQAGKFEEAIGHYEQTLRLTPDDAAAHNSLGGCLSRLGKVQEAVAHYEQALRIKPDFAEAHYNLGNALKQAGKIEEAVAHYEQALRIRPDFAEAHYNLGNTLKQAGKIKEAVAHYEQALRIRPDFAETHYNLGLALSRIGRIQDAVGHYEQALRIKPDFPEVHYNLGVALVQLGRLQEAVGHWEQALQSKPDYAEADNNLAWLLATLAPADGGDPVRAVTLAERACELTNNRVAAYLDTLAVAYSAAGRFNDAIAAAQKAIELARFAGQTQMVSEIETRLELYRAGRVFRAPVSVTSPHAP
jgi:tetratricopeptide (TPR) repeat protein